MMKIRMQCKIKGKTLTLKLPFLELGGCTISV
jgi:hypothetical protein